MRGEAVTDFYFAPLTDEQNQHVSAVIEKIGSRSLRANCCVANARLLREADPTGRIDYVEGLLLTDIRTFADSKPYPCPPLRHAWNRCDGRDFDVTVVLGWRNMLKVFPYTKPHTYSYRYAPDEDEKPEHSPAKFEERIMAAGEEQKTA
jgi:hypothetical protein